MVLIEYFNAVPGTTFVVNLTNGVDITFANVGDIHDLSESAATSVLNNNSEHFRPYSGTVGGGGGGAVTSVFGRAGVVTATAGDYDESDISASATATNYTPTGSTVAGHLSGIDTALATFPTAKQNVVADITARDALTGMADGDNAYVVDASGDATVTAGAALYVYSSSAWVKIAEFESLDLTVENFADTDLTVTANRTHDMATFNVAYTNAGNQSMTDGTDTKTDTISSVGFSDGTLVSSYAKTTYSITDGTDTATGVKDSVGFSDGTLVSSYGKTQSSITDGTDTMTVDKDNVGFSDGTLISTYEKTQATITDGTDTMTLTKNDLDILRVTPTLATTIPGWVTAKAYIVGDVVDQGFTLYKCIVAHTSGTFDTDFIASNREPITANIRKSASVSASGAISAEVTFASGTISLSLPTGIPGWVLDVKNIGTGVITVTGNMDTGTSFAVTTFDLSSAVSQTFACVSAGERARI